MSGEVKEYRPNDSPNDLSSTQLALALSTLAVKSSNHAITPLVLGGDRAPPILSLSALDIGPDGIFSFPNNVSRIEALNATLEPEKYGLDFWESLEGQLISTLVQLHWDSPTVISGYTETGLSRMDTQRMVQF
ncbi:hypothetical protein E1B28_012491 [Marasmius oreades]|uniref:Uncharacterized protein n=1 Tax=Marasmius oreades TaxID=181124 RepID=A0A9P7UQU6_9AGAR|nr:uncharacterized protein E1B28_012491 [Marasmius oreades]KAG7088504.1 hypothetical protein E1B28_012491 [Marasmius oreades]